MEKLKILLFPVYEYFDDKITKKLTDNWDDHANSKGENNDCCVSLILFLHSKVRCIDKILTFTTIIMKSSQVDYIIASTKRNVGDEGLTEKVCYNFTEFLNCIL